MPNSRQLRSRASSCALAISSVTGSIERPRRRVVVHRGDRQVRSADLAAGQPQAVERLRRGHFVDEMQVDIEQRGLAGSIANDVRGPDLFEERLGGHLSRRSLQCA